MKNIYAIIALAIAFSGISLAANNWWQPGRGIGANPTRSVISTQQYSTSNRRGYMHEGQNNRQYTNQNDQYNAANSGSRARSNSVGSYLR